MWQALSENLDSNRTEILHNIDDILGNSAITVGSWKLVQGTSYNGQWDDWYGPSGRSGQYNVSLVNSSPAQIALETLSMATNDSLIEELRQEATLSCTKLGSASRDCHPLEAPCLFNVLLDPCEKRNVADM